MSDNTKRVTFSLYDDDVKKLNDWSVKFNVSMSWLIRYMINSADSLENCESFMELLFYKNR